MLSRAEDFKRARDGTNTTPYIVLLNLPTLHSLPTYPPTNCTLDMLGRLVHYTVDAVLLSTVIAGVRRSSGFECVSLCNVSPLSQRIIWLSITTRTLDPILISWQNRRWSLSPISSWVLGRLCSTLYRPQWSTVSTLRNGSELKMWFWCVLCTHWVEYNTWTCYWLAGWLSGQDFTVISSPSIPVTYRIAVLSLYNSTQKKPFAKIQQCGSPSTNCSYLGLGLQIPPTKPLILRIATMAIRYVRLTHPWVIS